jgi:hypothetical protein
VVQLAAFGPVGDWLTHTQDDVGEELVVGRSHVQCRVGRQVDLSSGKVSGGGEAEHGGMESSTPQGRTL